MGWRQNGLMCELRTSRAASVSALLAAVLLFLNVPSPRADIVGNPPDVVGVSKRHVAGFADTLIDLAQTYRVGFIALRAANPGLNAWYPGEGVELTIPTRHVLPSGPRRGIVINLAELRLYHFAPGEPVASYPIGIGQEGWETPLGLTAILAKRVDPTWYPPPSIRAERPELPAAVAPGPSNPLGPRGLYLGFASYVIHGTNKPAGVGRFVSRGCIRLYNQDIEELYERVEVGTAVAIIYESVKLGWLDRALYIEVHPTREQAFEIEETGLHTPSAELGVSERIVGMVGDAGRVDWDAVGRAIRERRGIPIRITHDN